MTLSYTKPTRKMLGSGVLCIVWCPRIPAPPPGQSLPAQRLSPEPNADLVVHLKHADRHLPSAPRGVCTRTRGRDATASGPDRCRVCEWSLQCTGWVVRGSGRAGDGAGAPLAGVAARTRGRRRPHRVWAAGASPPPVNGDKQPCAGAQVAGAQSAGTQGARDGQKGQPGTGSPKALKRGWLGQPCATRGAFETWSFCSSAPPS